MCRDEYANLAVVTSSLCACALESIVCMLNIFSICQLQPDHAGKWLNPV